MKDLIIVSDFDGTITERDGLYTFIKEYAKGDWEKIEQDWADGKISSKECLIEEFKLVPDLSEELIAGFVKTICIDEYFKDFYLKISEQNIDFCIVSDGIDYFINKIFEQYNIKNIKIISNHGEFKNGKFEFSFPNNSKNCINNLGTCKCNIVKEMKNLYKKVIFIGDGVSDYCVADKADYLFAKSSLIKYCEKNHIRHSKFNNFSEIKIHPSDF